MSRYPFLLAFTILPLLVSPTPGAADGHEAGAQLTLQDLRTFTDIFDQVRKNYVEEIDDRTLLRAAIRGMMDELDPYSSFTGADESHLLEDASQGREAGLGANFAVRDQRIEVEAVVEGGPADAAGLQPGDVVLAIDDQPVRGRPLSDSFKALGGAAGTAVSLRLLTRPGKTREVTLTRQWSRVKSVSVEVEAPGFARLRIGLFHNDTAAEFREALATLLGDGALRGLIIDLRGNGGGVLRAAVDTADALLDGGRIVYTRGRYAATRLDYAATPATSTPGDLPVAVLVDERTASAAEVLAGALQDHGRARVFGRKTFGKGSIQSVLNLRDGGALRLTTAHYFTPLGRSLEGQGIEPDEATREEQDLDSAMAWLSLKARG